MDGTIGKTTLSLQIGGGGGDVVKLSQVKRDFRMAKGDLDQNDVVIAVVQVKEYGTCVE